MQTLMFVLEMAVSAYLLIGFMVIALAAWLIAKIAQPGEER